MPRIDAADSMSVIEREKAVCKKFGKYFYPEAALKRRDDLEAFWENFDLENKACLDAGSGHAVIPAILTAKYPSIRFDCVDISPDFEKEAGKSIRELNGDLKRIRLVTADFYDIGRLAEKGVLRNRYDYILLAESLHHSLRKGYLLSILKELMDEGSIMILMEPVLPRFFRSKAHRSLAEARAMGYIEEPVVMREYEAAIREAGLKIVSTDYDTSRESPEISWKRRLTPDFVYEFYRRRVRPMYAMTSFIFVCRLES